MIIKFEWCKVFDPYDGRKLKNACIIANVNACECCKNVYVIHDVLAVVGTIHTSGSFIKLVERSFIKLGVEKWLEEENTDVKSSL